MKPGLLWNKVATDPSQQYVYQMDFQRELNTKRKWKEYKDLYIDGGWEYVGSVGPLWHYFRKSVSAGEPYKLYTDNPSHIDYYRRIRNVIAVVTFANIAIAVINMIVNGYDFMGFRFSLNMVHALVTIILIYGYLGLTLRIKRLQRDSGSEKGL